MKFIVIISAAGVLGFFGKVGFVIYEALCMDFDFDRPWPEDNIDTGRVTLDRVTYDRVTYDSTEKPKVSDSGDIHWKKEIEEINSIRLYRS